MQPNPKLRLGIIKKVSFFMSERGHVQEPFRIRIYRADGPNHSPGTNLLTENIITAAHSGGQWFTVDLSSYVVDVPHDGFFVAMEWINGAGTTDRGFLSTDGFTTPSQVLLPTYEFLDNRTWTFNIGKGWSLLTLKYPKHKACNAMIRAEIEVLK